MRSTFNVTFASLYLLSMRIKEKFSSNDEYIEKLRMTFTRQETSCRQNDESKFALGLWTIQENQYWLTVRINDFTITHSTVSALNGLTVKKLRNVTH